jgi:hypothetical protein
MGEPVVEILYAAYIPPGQVQVQHESHASVITADQIGPNGSNETKNKEIEK